MRAFDFLEPRSVQEASAMLLQHGEGARALAGGTSLVLLLRQRLAEPTHLVHLGNLGELRGIRVDDEGQLRIGALATHGEVAAHVAIREQFPGDCRDGCHRSPIRRSATSPRWEATSATATRPPIRQPAWSRSARACASGAMTTSARSRSNSFFKGYYENALDVGDVLVEVIVPPLPREGVALYSRFITTPAEGRPLTAAALRAVGGRDRWTEVRLALGAVMPAPARAVKAERFLAGRKLTPEVLAEAAELAVNDLDPLDDFRASGAYRREVTRVNVRRLLDRAAGVR